VLRTDSLRLVVIVAVMIVWLAMAVPRVRSQTGRSLDVNVSGPRGGAAIASSVGPGTVTVAATAQVMPTAEERPTIKIFGAGPRRGVAGEPIPFAVAVQAMNVSVATLKIDWDFGDGTDGTVPHTYAKAGVYPVSVAVSSPEAPGIADDLDVSVTISDAIMGIVALTIDAQGTPNPTVHYPAGWNLVSGTTGTKFSAADGPLYTLAEDGDGYQAVSSRQGIEAGRAYWAYFATPATMTLAGPADNENDLLAPRGAYAMLGNPVAAFPVSIRGASAAYTWEPAGERYVTSTSLQPGQGAWVIAAGSDVNP
jgi:hypothetical protein